MRKKAGGAHGACAIRYSAAGGETAAIAARELASGLGAMLGTALRAEPGPAIRDHELAVYFGPPAPGAPDQAALSGDAFEVLRPGADAIVIRAGCGRGLLHGACDLLERLGARFAPGVAPRFPRHEPARLSRVEPYRVIPAFSRRAFVSDLMTWNYNFPDRLAEHLAFDREFIPWMARRGINAFEYISHAHDTRLRIDELVPLYDAYGIGCEYGGHVLQILLPRGKFERSPELFPAGEDGKRMRRGNLCVSSADAMGLVRAGALRLVREHPESRLLHVWGADVSGGAWCRCSGCRRLSPQLQYLTVVNAIAAAAEAAAVRVPVAYLAYHDTLEPDPNLRPLPNVWFEWAPRERCYAHAIDDGACAANPRYFESLKRYLEIFEGRGHVFEYYADAILFGGLGLATPAVIARDLRAYRRLGIESVSCLTFGAYSALAYPVNLEAFVRGARAPDFDPERTLADTAAGRHPESAGRMAQAYRAVERAAALVLDYADVMRPYTMGPRQAAAKQGELARAVRCLESAVKTAARVRARAPLAGAEEELWNYGIEVLSAIGDYLRAREERGAVRRALGEAAIVNIAGAIEHVRKISAQLKGAWGAYDLEWIRELWLESLRRNLAEDEQDPGAAD